MQEIIQTRQQRTPPPPPRPPIPVEVPDDTMLEDDDLPLGDPLEIAVLTLPPPPLPDAEPEEKEDEIFMIVEDMPEIVGGQAALFAALSYPVVAQRAGIEGMVIVEITVNPDGTASDAEVIRSAHEILDKTAVEAVLKQEFKPGRQRGRAVHVRMAIPVKFRLQNS